MSRIESEYKKYKKFRQKMSLLLQSIIYIGLGMVIMFVGYVIFGSGIALVIKLFE